MKSKNLAKMDPLPGPAAPSAIFELPRLVSKRRQQQQHEAPTSLISETLTRDARILFGERMRDHLLSNEELDVLWDELWQNASRGTDEARKMTNLDFERIKSRLAPKFHTFFKPSIFLKFVPDEAGNISVLQFFNYVLRKVSLMQARLDLSYYDANNDGHLTESELNQYISDLIPALKLSALNPNVYEYYVCSAVRKFLFFMDPLKRGKVPIQKILLSPILTELFELREPELPDDLEKTNWFSSYYALKIYGQYLALDVDHNGLLSREEMGQFNNSTLTNLYLDRLFEERQTRNQQIDYKTFVDLVLAIENPSTPESITYQFKLLDVNRQGYLDDFSVGYLFTAVVEKMLGFGHEPVHVADVVNEVFDMANPTNPERITLDDLLKCGVGGTITTILTDCRGFWAYDNRESLEAR
ncbi:hypothetical protein HDU98_010038 [Podochytrium sp. JEL0797]|nr:hypothetical protein HDU98_010038 [Podochytrium sp. JEL0797]